MVMDTKALAPIPSFYGVYLLQSILNPSKFYIGSTPDPLRRLKQHNGLIKGGAKKTIKSRPWDMIAIVGGFPSSRHALRFEWAWQNTDLTTAVPKELRLKHDSFRNPQHYQDQGLNKKKEKETSKPTRKPKSLTNLQKRFANLALLLCVETFARWPLELRLFDPKVYETWETINLIYNYPRDLPLKIIFEESSSFRETPKEKNSLASVTGRPDDRGHDVLRNIDLTYRSLQNHLAKSISTLYAGSSLSCDICGQILAQPTDIYAVTCTRKSCKCVTHMTCLANHYLQNERNEAGDRLDCLPISGPCPLCNEKATWIEIVKEHSVRVRSNRSVDPVEGVEERENSSDDCSGSESGCSSQESHLEGHGDASLENYEDWFWKPEDDFV